MTDILSRYSKFSMGLRTSVSSEVRVLFNLCARDLQSTTAKNIKFVENKSGSDLWEVGPGKLKDMLHSNLLVAIPNQVEWRVEYLDSLLRQLVEAKCHVQEAKETRIQELIDSRTK